MQPASRAAAVRRSGPVTASPWAGRSSASASVTTWRGDLAQGGLVVVDDVDAAQERLHRQAAAVAGAAAGGQHVVGAGDVVAEADRRERPDEDGAGVADPRGDRGRVAGLDLQVLGGVGVDDRQPGVEVVDEDDRRTGVPVSAVRTRSGCLVAATRSLERLLDRVGQRLAVGDQDRRPPAGRARPG